MNRILKASSPQPSPAKEEEKMALPILPRSAPERMLFT